MLALQLYVLLLHSYDIRNRIVKSQHVVSSCRLQHLITLHGSYHHHLQLLSAIEASLYAVEQLMDVASALSEGREH